MKILTTLLQSALCTDTYVPKVNYPDGKVVSAVIIIIPPWVPLLASTQLSWTHSQTPNACQIVGVGNETTIAIESMVVKGQVH